MLTNVSSAAFNSAQAPVLPTITAQLRYFKRRHARDHRFPRYRVYRISRPLAALPALGARALKLAREPGSRPVW